MKPFILRATLLAALALTSLAEAASTSLAKVFIGPDGLAHIVDAAGRDQTFTRETGQVSVADPRLSDDRRAAGWRVEELNCCTSYPIPLRLAVYRNGRKQIISPGLMIYDWAFVAGGREVALSSGVVHGATERTFDLYSVRSGRRLAHSTGDARATPPRWALRLRQ